MSGYQHRVADLIVDAVEVPAIDGDWSEVTAWLAARGAVIVGLGGDWLVLTVDGDPVAPVWPGWWIVDGLDEVSPCTPDGFAATYELV